MNRIITVILVVCIGHGHNVMFLPIRTRVFLLMVVIVFELERFNAIYMQNMVTNHGNFRGSLKR